MYCFTSSMWLVIPPYQRIVNYQSLDVALYMQRLLTTPIISFRKKLIFLEQIPSRYYSRYRKYLEPPPRIRNQLMVRTIDIALIVYIVLLAYTDPLFCYRYLIVNVYCRQTNPCNLPPSSISSKIWLVDAVWYRCHVVEKILINFESR